MNLELRGKKLINGTVYPWVQSQKQDQINPKSRMYESSPQTTSGINSVSVKVKSGDGNHRIIKKNYELVPTN